MTRIQRDIRSRAPVCIETILQTVIVGRYLRKKCWVNPE